VRHALLAAVLGSILIPFTAAAQVSLGARVGWAFPAGDAYESSGIGTFKQSDLASGVAVLQADATWRFGPALSAGVYYGYGLGRAGSKLKDLCSGPGASCESPTTMRFGAQAAWAFLLGSRVEPWVGLAAGLQSTTFKVKHWVSPFTPSGSDLKGTLRGWEAALEGGADHRLTPGFVVGPLVTLGLGQYTVQDVTIDALGKVAGGGVDSAKTHEWITLGVRGRFDL
jgi:hypothetical protein